VRDGAGSDLKVAVMGGGTGIYAVLTGLRHHTDQITAIVSMSDNGGSSGRLRDEFGFLPPGDVRRCLVALASDDEAHVLRRLFEYRFDRGHGLNGHTFGNLLLTALTDILGGEDRAIDAAAQILNIHGRVLPVTLADTTLCARLSDGHVIHGETDIDVRKAYHDAAIEEVYLEPSDVDANPEALAAIAGADLIVLGPGDLYTSIVPNLLVPGIAEAIRDARGKRVYVCNVMTKAGETDGFAASDFIREIQRYLGGDVLDAAVLNYHESLPRDLYERYKAEGSEPVAIDLGGCYERVPQLAIRPLTAAGALVRHNPDLLAQTLLEVAHTDATELAVG